MHEKSQRKPDLCLSFHIMIIYAKSLDSFCANHQAGMMFDGNVSKSQCKKATNKRQKVKTCSICSVKATTLGLPASAPVSLEQSQCVFPQKSETRLIYLETNTRCQRKLLPTLTPGVSGDGGTENKIKVVPCCVFCFYRVVVSFLFGVFLIVLLVGFFVDLILFLHNIFGQLE